jgi:hypothetical protein
LSLILCSISLLSSLAPVLCSMCHFSVPCLTSLFLVSRSLFPV